MLFDRIYFEALTIRASTDHGVYKDKSITLYFIENENTFEAIKTVQTNAIDLYDAQNIDENLRLFTVAAEDGAGISNPRYAIAYDPDRVFEIDSNGNVTFRNDTVLDQDTTYFAIFLIYNGNSSQHARDLGVTLTINDAITLTSEDTLGILQGDYAIGDELYRATSSLDDSKERWSLVSDDDRFVIAVISGDAEEAQSTLKWIGGKNKTPIKQHKSLKAGGAMPLAPPHAVGLIFDEGKSLR